MRSTALTVILACLAASNAPAAPIYVCYANQTARVMNFGVSYPAGGSSNTTVAPGVSLRQGGDSDGVYCISPTYAGHPLDCPVDDPSTFSGFQVELQCE